MEVIKLRGLAIKSDTINTNIHITQTKIGEYKKYGWATIEKIFSYLGSLGMKLSQKVLGVPLDSHCSFPHKVTDVKKTISSLPLLLNFWTSLSTVAHGVLLDGLTSSAPLFIFVCGQLHPSQSLWPQ